MSRNPFVNEDEFLRGYLEAAVWSSNDPDTETPLDDEYSVEDIDSDWREVAREDCAVFCRNYGTLLRGFGEALNRDAASLGHDFWLTRNRHGSGFWARYMDASSRDRALARELGNRLTFACQAYPEVDLMPIGEGLIGS